MVVVITPGLVISCVLLGSKSAVVEATVAVLLRVARLELDVGIGTTSPAGV